MKTIIYIIVKLAKFWWNLAQLQPLITQTKVLISISVKIPSRDFISKQPKTYGIVVKDYRFRLKCVKILRLMAQTDAAFNSYCIISAFSSIRSFRLNENMSSSLSPINLVISKTMYSTLISINLFFTTSPPPLPSHDYEYQN